MNLELKRVLFNITALSDLGREVTSANDLGMKMRSALYVIMGTFVCMRGAVLLYDKQGGGLITLDRKGFDQGWPEFLSFTNGYIRELERNRAYNLRSKAVAAGNDGFFDRLIQTGAEVFVPLWTREEFMGALLLGEKLSTDPFSDGDFELLGVIASQLAITIHNHLLFADLAEKLEENRDLYQDMREIYHETIQAFAAAIDAKDAYTKNHSYRVARYVLAIAEELGWDKDAGEGIYIAGLLHDIGKIILRDDVLNKKTPLTEEEREELRRHSTMSYDIISKVNFPWKGVVETVRHHHERLDGAGYPDSLDAEQLNDGEKILALADAFDAMTTDRPYRRRMELKAALEELKRCVGTQFDGRIMVAFCRVLEKELAGQLPHPDILPHLPRDFDPSVISSMLRAIIRELSE